MTVAGPLEAVADTSPPVALMPIWIVKLIDVYPPSDPERGPGGVPMGGYQQLVRGDVMRGKFRASFEKPAPFVPGEVTEVAFAMQDVYHTFRAGHRVMVHVQASWFPLVDRNPQTFVDIYNARPEDFRPATHRLHRSAARPSSIGLRRMP